MAAAAWVRHVLTRLAIAVLAAGVLVGWGGPPANADPVPIPDPYGFTSADVGFIDGGDAPGAPARIAAMDDYVGDRKPVVRIDLFWSDVQPCATCAPRWERLDALVDAAHRRGMRVRFTLADQTMIDGNSVMLNLPDNKNRVYDLVLIGPRLSARELVKGVKPVTTQ